jgi:hypothetical protein
VTASHGTYDIGKDFDIGEILKFVVAVWAACEYSRQHSRRITLARRNRAKDGRRSGGSAPYGMAAADGNFRPVTPETKVDDRYNLIPGDAQEIKTVRWLFDQVGNELRSMNSLARELNDRKKIPSPNGGKWTVRTIRKILRRRCYIGDFEFNKVHCGQFYGIDEKGEVVEASELNGKRKVFEQGGIYTPLVERALFDKVQRRLDTLARERGRRRNDYALSGILRCGRCGGPLRGAKPNGQPTVYRCSAAPDGTACGREQVREDRILPFLFKLLERTIKDLTNLKSRPPEHVRKAGQERAEKCKRMEKERDDLKQKIDHAMENLLRPLDDETFKALSERLSAMRSELSALEQQLAEAETAARPASNLGALLKWYANFLTTAVRVEGKEDEPIRFADPRKVNAALHEIGAWVKLWWRTEKPEGCTRERHILVKGQFKLGQFEGNLPHYCLATPVRGRPDIRVSTDAHCRVRPPLGTCRPRR